MSKHFVRPAVALLLGLCCCWRYGWYANVDGVA